MGSFDKKQFWDNKILTWESNKYSSPPGILRQICDPNQSLKSRLKITRNILSQISKGCVVIELGCGTARLLPALIDAGVKKYIGVDISGVAILEAKKRAQELRAEDITEFHQADTGSFRGGGADICFSIGLLDWLDLNEIRRTLSRINCSYYFHSFSEKRVSLQQIMHKLYVFVLYGHRTKSYVPRYYRYDQIAEVFNARYGSSPKVFRSRQYPLGAFVYQLPEGVCSRDE